MTHCETCPIDDKTYECCGRFPETGETACLKIGEDRMIAACPHLSACGKCRVYEQRPYACQAHDCFRYDTANEMGAGFQALRDQWSDKWL